MPGPPSGEAPPSACEAGVWLPREACASASSDQLRAFVGAATERLFKLRTGVPAQPPPGLPSEAQATSLGWPLHLGREPWAEHLELVTLERPEALHAELPTLCAGLADWAAASCDAGPRDAEDSLWVARVLHAVSLALPGWASTQAKPRGQPAAVAALRKQLQRLLARSPSFSLLLRGQRLQLVRNAAECSAVIAVHVTGEAAAVLKQASGLCEVLARAVETERDLNVQEQAELCQGAWVLCIAVKVLRGHPYAEAAVGLPAMVAAAVSAIATLSRGGPSALRPALIPCLGVLLRGHGHLLYSDQGLMECLRAGLSPGSRALQARTAETVAELLEAEAACRRRFGASAACSTASRLAELQPELVRIFRDVDTAPAAAAGAAVALRALHGLNALCVPDALPSLLAACLAGRAAVAREAVSVVAFVAKPGGAMITSLASGIELAAARFAKQRPDGEPGEILREAWRFSAFAAPCLEPLQAAGIEEGVVSELLGILDNLGGAGSTAQQVCSAELVCGLLAEVLRSTSSVCDAVLQRAAKLKKDIGMGRHGGFAFLGPACRGPLLGTGLALAALSASASAWGVSRGANPPHPTAVAAEDEVVCSKIEVVHEAFASLAGGLLAAMPDAAALKEAVDCVAGIDITQPGSVASLAGANQFVLSSSATRASASSRPSPRRRSCAHPSVGRLAAATVQRLRRTAAVAEASPCQLDPRRPHRQQRDQDGAQPVLLPEAQPEAAAWPHGRSQQPPQVQGPGVQPQPPELPLLQSGEPLQPLQLLDWPAPGGSDQASAPHLPVLEGEAVHGAGGHEAALGDRLAAEAQAFTPMEVNVDACMARTWSKGLGGQCGRSRVEGNDFCIQHLRGEQWKVHGRVDGDIPGPKLKEFLRARAQQAEARLHLENAEPQGHPAPPLIEQAEGQPLQDLQPQMANPSGQPPLPLPSKAAEGLDVDGLAGGAHKRPMEAAALCKPEVLGTSAGVARGKRHRVGGA